MADALIIIGSLAMTAGVLYLIGRMIFRMFRSSGPAKHCMMCGADGPTKLHTRGSIWIEIVLWLMFLLPGLIYSIWRMTTKKEVCSACGAETLIPLESPAATSHRKALAG